MSGFDASWLDLREPADHRSRNEELARLLDAALRQPAPDRRPRPRLRHRLQPARHRAAARARAALDAGRPRRSACSMPPSTRLAPGPTAAERRTTSSCSSKGGKRITVRFRRADLAATSSARSRRQRRPGHRLGAVRSGLGRLHRRGSPPRSRAGKRGLLHGADLQRRAALDPEARGRRRDGRRLPRPQVTRQGLRPSRRPDGAAMLLSAAFDAAGYTVQRRRQRLAAGGRRRGADRRAGAGLCRRRARDQHWFQRTRSKPGSKMQRTGALVGHTDTLALPA